MSAKKVIPELMSPAGYWPQLRAAVEAGADAVYFGLKHFSARAKVGFTLDELPKAMEELHSRGVKGFVTFNTLIFDHEIGMATKAIAAIANAGVDAVIVQDIGIADFVHKNAPDLEIHGSTQMSITSAEGAELAKSLGCNRVVLGRELSLSDMRKVASQTDVELEVFVHGALCVSYSGQCFSSEAWGGRSANRGQCAQACRLAYDLIVDGERKKLGDARYLLSPGDLFALEQIPELVEMGISCVKIEGRYKSPEYVALTTKAYREAIDAAVENRQSKNDLETHQDLEQIYSRGLGAHFISGINHQAVVEGRAPRHRGRKAGQVTQVLFSSVVIRPEFELSAGDGVVFDAAHRRSPGEKEEGGFLYRVEEYSETEVELIFGKGEVDFERIAIGDLIWRTQDPQLNKRLKPLTQAQDPVYTRPVNFSVSATAGKPLAVSAHCDGIHEANFLSDEKLAAAEKRAVDQSQLKNQLGRLGGTAFHLGQVELVSEKPAFVPVSLLNKARRVLVSELVKKRTSQQPATVEIGEPILHKVERNESTVHEPESGPSLHVLVRNSEQLDAAIENGPDSITLDYLELYGLRKSVEKIKANGIVARVASPRVLKPSEEKVVRFLLSLEVELLIRSGGLLYQLNQMEKNRLPDLIGDFSLNVANQLSCQRMFELGLKRITPTHDLNGEQVAELAELSDPQRIEVIAFHHLPVFHTEHCVFCRFLSEGTDNTNCGHPCETHQIALADAQGRQHPVMADVGCRNTVFGAEAQYAGKFLQQWQASQISHYRIEFVHESAEQVGEIVAAFQNYLANKTSVDELSRRVFRQCKAGTTEGSLYVPADFKKLVQLS